MTIAIVGPERLRELVTFERLIEPVADAYRRTSAGSAENRMLVIHPLEDPAQGDILVKAGAVRGSPVCVVKVAPWFAGNSGRGLTQGGFIAVLDAKTGHTLALLDDQHHLSDVRTAAAGAIAARLLAPANVGSATIVGAGTQAYWQARALHSQRPFRNLSIWSRDPAKALALASRLEADLPNVAVAVAGELRPAVEGAEVIVTATAAREPLVHGDWLRAGQHVTAVGADDPGKCELDASALRRARVFVEEISTAAENGDIRRATAEGRYNSSSLAGEIGQVLVGRIAGRRSADEITIAKLVGIGAMDVAAAQVALAAVGLP